MNILTLQLHNPTVLLRVQVKEEINETITSGHSVFDDDPDEEHYEDVMEDDSKEMKPDISHKICGWTWRSPASASSLGSTLGSSKAKHDPTSYDPLARVLHNLK